jgi:signal transduction histidine kinase
MKIYFLVLALNFSYFLFSQTKDKHYQKVADICRSIDSLSSVNDSLCAIEINKLYKIVKPLDNPMYLSYYYRRIGLFYLSKEEFLKALENFQESAIISKDLNDKWSLASDYSNIGDVYFEMNEFDKALALYQKSLIYYNQRKNKYDFFKGFVKSQMAKIYYAKNDLNLTLGYAIKATEQMESLNNHSPSINRESFRAKYLLRNHLLLAKVYLKKEDLALVERQLIKAEYYLSKYDLNEYLPEYHLLLFRLEFRSTSEIKDLDKLKYYLDLSNTLKKYSLTIKYFELLKKYAQKKNDHHNMVSFSDSIILYTKNLFQFDKAKSISLYQAQFETQKAEFETQEAENRTQKERRKGFMYLIGLISVGTILAFVLYIWRTRQKASLAKMKIKDLKISSLLHKNELENLKGILEGQEKERNRIAQDLHDSLGGLLASVKMHFNALEKKIVFPGKEEKSMFIKTNHLLDDSCNEVRRVAHDLHTSMNKNKGFKEQLNNLKNAILLNNDLEMNIIYEVEENILDLQSEQELYKITLELISNTLKHAQASKIDIQIINHEDEIDYIYEDNGVGFQMNNINRGLGLTSIEKRVNKIGGTLEIDTHEKSGSTFIISLNKKEL